MNLNNTKDEIKDFAIESLEIIEMKKNLRSNVLTEKDKLFTQVRKDPIIQNLEYNNPIGSKFLDKTVIY